MTEPSLSAIPPMLSALRALPVWILSGLTLAGLAILYMPAFGGVDPSGFRKDWGVSVWAGTILCAILAGARLIDSVITNYASRRTTRIERVEIFIVLAKTIHDKLLSWGTLDSVYLDGCLNRLEQSEDSIWIDDEVRDARTVFIDQARQALEVRRTRYDYRNPIERSETKEYLDNSKDRLVAALLKQKLPEFFDPYHEDDAPSWWQRVWRRGVPPEDDIMRLSSDTTSTKP
jgi:hypothetical protein